MIKLAIDCIFSNYLSQLQYVHTNDTIPIKTPFTYGICPLYAARLLFHLSVIARFMAKRNTRTIPKQHLNTA